MIKDKQGIQPELRRALIDTGSVEIPVGTPVNAVAASFETDLTGDNNDLEFTAKTKGAPGNSIEIAYIDPEGNDQNLAIVVDGKSIIVNLATGATGDITTTAEDIATAIAADEDADALVEVANKDGNNGTGVVEAIEAEALEGGVDGTPALKGAVLIDATRLYTAPEGNTVSGANWLRSAELVTY